MPKRFVNSLCEHTELRAQLRKESATARVVNPPNRSSAVPEFQLVQRHDRRKLQQSGNGDAQHGHAASSSAAAVEPSRAAATSGNQLAPSGAARDGAAALTVWTRAPPPQEPPEIYESFSLGGRRRRSRHCLSLLQWGLLIGYC